MVECKDRPRFMFETPDAIFFTRQVQRQYFEGNFAIVLFGILGEEYFAHSAFAQSLKNTIVTDKFRS
jgi:hypothetical protein